MSIPDGRRIEPTRLRRWMRNVGSSYGDLLVGGIIYLLMTPLLIRHLGLELYALWLVSHVITFYLQLLDFGFNEAQVRFHARYVAKNQQYLVRKLLATTTAALGVAGLVAGALAVAVAFSPVYGWFDMSAGVESELRAVLLVVAINLLLSIPGSTLECIYEGEQRFDLRNIRSIGLRLFTASLQLSLLLQGYGIVALAMVELLASVLRILIDLFMANRLVPGLFRGKFRFNPRIWWSILPFAIWAFIDDVIVEGSEHLDTLLVAFFLPMAMLTPYAMCAALGGILMVAAHPIAETIFPMASELHARGKRDALHRLFLAGSKGVTALAAPVAIFLVFFGSPVLMIWVPEAWEVLPAGLVQLVVIDILFSVYFTTGTVLLMAMGRIRFVAMLTVLELALTVLLIVLLVPRYGLIGFATAALTANVLVGFALLLPAACRACQVSLASFLARTLGRLSVAMLPAGLAAAGMMLLDVDPGVLFLAAAVVIIGAVYLPSILWLGTSPAERAGYEQVWRHSRRHLLNASPDLHATRRASP